MPQARRITKRKLISRQTRKFQLRMGEGYPVDKHVAEILDFKKSKRSEVTAIRDGVRLLWALENNDLSVLFELFPHLKDSFSGGGGQLTKIEAMLEIVVAGRKANEPVMQSEQPSMGKQIAGFKALAAPVEDDDMPALEFKKEAGHTATDNFMNMMKGLGAAPPKAVAKKAKEVSADEIATNFLSQF